MARPEGTEGFKFHHTMLRVKDPKASVDFYTTVIGMELLSKHDRGDFSLYFLAFNDEGQELTQEEKTEGVFAREAVLGLTHNHGTESDPDFKGYEAGRGFSHICVSVDDMASACDRFEKLGVPFKKRLGDGKAKRIAFILDPDGYSVEVIPRDLRP